MRSLLLSGLTLLFLWIRIGQSEEDLCETVRFVKKKVAFRCCQVDNHTLEESDRTALQESEEVTINFNGVFFLCKEGARTANESLKPKVKVGRIVSPKSYEKNRNTSESENKNGTVPDLANRHFGDVPGRCPDGMILDSVGECVEVWD